MINAKVTSLKGRNFITKVEGERLKVYKDQAGLDTIGVGHLLKNFDDINWSDKNIITKEESQRLLNLDLRYSERAVCRELGNRVVNQNQFDALVSFTFNVGSTAFEKSTLLKRIKEHDNYDEIKRQFLRWNKVKVKGKYKISRGLAKRRLAEFNLYKEASLNFNTYKDKVHVEITTTTDEDQPWYVKLFNKLFN